MPVFILFKYEFRELVISFLSFTDVFLMFIKKVFAFQ